MLASLFQLVFAISRRLPPLLFVGMICVNFGGMAWKSFFAYAGLLTMAYFIYSVARMRLGTSQIFEKHDPERRFRVIVMQSAHIDYNHPDCPPEMRQETLLLLSRWMPELSINILLFVIISCFATSRRFFEVWLTF